jgi:multidrug efflux system outer membrane protein
VPSELLDRRPDVREAERKLRAAALEVGIRKTDFLPRVRLTGTGGVASLRTQRLFTSPDSFFYDLGPQVDLPVFQAGTLRAGIGQAEAAWREAVAGFESVLLEAVRETEDSLLDLQVLRTQIASQAAAVAAARKTAELSRLRYDRGLVSYLEVVDAERARLQAERIENALRAEQAAATVQLVQALGGGW